MATESLRKGLSKSYPISSIHRIERQIDFIRKNWQNGCIDQQGQKVRERSQMKLHLGCGERYLKGYLNIDFPSEEHTVQVKSVADQYADITCLRYPKESVEEVRLHHVYEHFPRPVAIALAVAWYSWIQPGGRLHIEVPDFAQTARRVLSPWSSFRSKMTAMRHLFGSQEARWAIHCEGWTQQSLRLLLKEIGFGSFRFLRSHWRGTYNFELISTKEMSPPKTRSELARIVENHLKNYLLDESETEKKLLQVWMKAFNEQLDRSWGLDA